MIVDRRKEDDQYQNEERLFLIHSSAPAFGYIKRTVGHLCYCTETGL